MTTYDLAVSSELVFNFLYYPRTHLTFCFNLLIPEETETDQYLNGSFQLPFHWLRMQELISRNHGHELKNHELRNYISKFNTGVTKRFVIKHLRSYNMCSCCVKKTTEGMSEWNLEVHKANEKEIYKGEEQIWVGQVLL